MSTKQTAAEAVSEQYARIPTRLRQQVRGDRFYLLIELILRCNEEWNWKSFAVSFELGDLCRDLEWESERTSEKERLAARTKLRRCLEWLDAAGLIEAKAGKGRNAMWRVRITGALVADDLPARGELSQEGGRSSSPEGVGLRLASGKRDRPAAPTTEKPAPAAGSRQSETRHVESKHDTNATDGGSGNATRSRGEQRATPLAERDPTDAKRDTAAAAKRDRNATASEAVDEVAEARERNRLERLEGRPTSVAGLTLPTAVGEQLGLGGMPTRPKPETAP